MDSSQRKYHRLAAQIDCEITCEDQPTMEARIRDVSLCGVFVCCDDSLPVDSNCQVYFVDGETTGTLVGPVPGIVTRTDDDGMAIEFDGVPDDECIDFLQNLMLNPEMG